MQELQINWKWPVKAIGCSRSMSHLGDLWVWVAVLASFWGVRFIRGVVRRRYRWWSRHRKGEQSTIMLRISLLSPFLKCPKFRRWIFLWGDSRSPNCEWTSVSRRHDFPLSLSPVPLELGHNADDLSCLLVSLKSEIKSLNKILLNSYFQLELFMLLKCLWLINLSPV